MAQFIGKRQLEEKLSSKGLSNNVIKGFKGELRVGELLAQYLPTDTFVIAHPAIGKYDPDFLIISPEYGFRLVEVKNWNIENIDEIHSNGAIKIYNSLQNPLKQVKNHSEEFNGYIQSLGIPALRDPFRVVGYTVIHNSFTRDQIKRKINGWELNNKEDFFRFHIFSDQLGNEMSSLLKRATKFQVANTNKILPDPVIERILNSITVTNDITYDAVLEFNNKLIEVDNKLSTLDASIKDLQQRSQSARMEELNRPIRPENSRSNKPWVYVAIVLMLLLIISMLIAYQPSTESTSENSDPVYNNVEQINNKVENGSVESTSNNIEQLKADAELGSNVELQANLEKFTYDKKSGTKFLVLSDGESTIGAVVFKGKESPFLNEGETYTFKGKMNNYEGQLEIVIDEVE
jgi:hypothetical protein